MFLPGSPALVRGITTNAGLNCIKLCNALQGFFGNARALRGVNIKELAWVNLAQKASRVRVVRRYATANQRKSPAVLRLCLRFME